MKYLITHFAGIPVCLAMMVIAALISCAILYLFRKMLPHESLSKNLNMSSLFFGAMSLLYSLIVAFVISAVWQDYETLEGYVIQESAKLENILENSRSLPDSLQKEVIADTKAYADAELQGEWNFERGSHRKSDEAINKLRKSLALYTTDEKIVKSQIETIESDIALVRQLQHNRYGNEQSHIPALVWFGLICCSLIVIVVSYFFTSESHRYEYFFTAALTGMMTMCLFIIYALDNPMIGVSGISAEPFQKIITWSPN